MKTEEKRKDILVALLNGRKLKRVGYQLKWEDGQRKPSLTNELTSFLFRAGMIRDEVKDHNKPQCGDNLTGYVILDGGRVYLKVKYGISKLH